MTTDHSNQESTRGSDRSVTIWCLSDGRTGHRRQIEGLVEQIDQRRSTIVHWIPVNGVGQWDLLRWWLRGQFPPGGALPAPQLILGAGHSTHWAALAARRSFGGKAVILMRPTLPTRLFDLSLVPEHDLESLLSRIDRCRVIPTRGVLNPFVPSESVDPAQALILIGGPSRHHGWSDEAILRQLRELVRVSPANITWTLTTSRRTPESLLKRLADAFSGDDYCQTIRLVPFAETTSGWLSEQLAGSSTVFVTEDSVSMVYEALTAGADVGLIGVPRRHPNSRNARCIDRIVAERFVIPFEQWQQSRFTQRRQETFHEAARCAEIVCAQLLDAA